MTTNQFFILVTLAFVAVINIRIIVCSMDRICTPGKNCRLPSAPIKPFRNTEIPQMVLLTFDGGLSPNLSQKLFNANRRNPDDCPISVTTFWEANSLNITTVYAEIQRGMEVSILGNLLLSNMTEKEAYDRILEVKTNMSSKIPHLQKVFGWRGSTDELAGRKLFNALSYIGFTYDSTLQVNRPADHKTFQWPFRLKRGWILPPCDNRGRCAQGDFPNLWEFPVISLFSEIHQATCHSLQNCSTMWGNNVKDVLLDNFRRFYNGNRAPFLVKIDTKWLTSDSYYIDGLDAFIDQMGFHPDVYMVSIEKAVKWLHNPTPVDRLHQFKEWQCPLHASSLNNPYQKLPKRPDPLSQVPKGESPLFWDWKSKNRKERVQVLFSPKSTSAVIHPTVPLVTLFWLLTHYLI